MFNNFKTSIFLFFYSIIFVSCNNNTQYENTNDQNKINLKQPLEQANKHLLKTEETEIDDYINRYGWNMQTTNTGLRYMIYKKVDNNISPEKGSIVKINYTVSLINGITCYTSDSTGPKIFEIGKGQVESGLEEGILLLKKEEKAKFIIPSHLAFGLAGDLNKIPKKATLIYDVELIDVKNIIH
jgi:FKBP-type peptidyl-prolyl cis-trans isomerase